MLWLCLGSLFFFIPFSVFAPDLLFGNTEIGEMQKQFFRLFMYLSPIHLVNITLSIFFIGQGKTRLVSILGLSSGILGSLLDYPFIFGVSGWLPPLGMQGAAWAIGCSESLLFIILLCLFFSRSNRQQYHTHKCTFEWPLFRDCVWVGFPSALLTASEKFGWTAYLMLMGDAGQLHIIVASIFNSLMFVLRVFPEGILKAIATLTGFHIGAQQAAATKKSVQSGIVLILLYCGIVAAVAFCWPNVITQPFFSSQAQSLKESLLSPLHFSLMLLPFYVLIKGINAIFIGVLKGSRDTWFKMVWGTLSIWLFLVLPTYTLVNQSVSVQVALLPIIGYAILSTIGYFLRLRFLQTSLKQQINAV